MTGASRSCSMSEVYCARWRREPLAASLQEVVRTRGSGGIQMLSSMSIGKRMGLAFSVLVALALSVAAAGYWGLTNVAKTAETILDVDVAGADLSGQVQATALDLRRYEKDYLLNIADPVARAQYLSKWKASYQTEQDLMNKLGRLLDTDAEREKLAAMRNALAGYD